MAAVLEKQVEELRKSNQEKDNLIASQAAKIQHLQLELMMALHRMWSRSSERFEPLGPLLFDELIPQEKPEEEKPAVQDDNSKTEKRGRKPLSPKLVRKDVPHDLDESDRMCNCGRCMKKIGEDYDEPSRQHTSGDFYQLIPLICDQAAASWNITFWKRAS